MSSPDDKSSDDLIIVARTVRTRGLKGELVADVLTDIPDRFEQLDELQAVTPKGERKSLRLENYWFQNDRVVLKFAGYDTVEAANDLVGYDLGVDESDRIALPEGEFYDWELEGCAVETNQGSKIGEVREVLRTGGVELLVVTSESGSDNLIPMAASIVLKVDVASKRIVVDPPEGLLDL